MTEAEPEVRVERLGRWLHEVTLVVSLGDGITMEMHPPALAFGRRWTRWQARRMLRAHLRSGESRMASGYEPPSMWIPPGRTEPHPPSPPSKTVCGCQGWRDG